MHRHCDTGQEQDEGENERPLWVESPKHIGIWNNRVGQRGWIQKNRTPVRLGRVGRE